MIDLPDDKTVMTLPPLFVCPECGARALYVEFDEWELESGTPTEAGTHVSCKNETGKRGDYHWQMPYVSLLPLEYAVYEWVSRNVRIVESESTTRARLAAWNAGEPIREATT